MPLGLFRKTPTKRPIQTTQEADRRIAAINQGRFLQSQVVTAGTSITSHAEARLWRYRIVGAGGGGGGCSSVSATDIRAGAGGGQGGGYAEGWIEVDPLTTYTCSIGSGGAGGTGGGNGSNGGNATLAIGATTITAPGGQGGNGMGGRDSGISDPFVAEGGANGTLPTNGDINVPGAPGGVGVVVDALLSAIWSGFGGGSPFGSGGAPLTGNSGNNTGNAGLGHGSGGSGAIIVTNTSRDGGAGSGALIEIEEYT